ncbi:MAG: class I SAM-dependent methyltransferase [Planctomycetota bacterium]
MTDRPVRDALHFFGRFLRSPGSVGAVLPSSRYLAQMLVGDLSAFRPGDTLVEYGPGTGAVTRRIAEALPAGVRYLGVELDASFVRRLAARFPQLEFHHGSVGDIEAIVRDRGLAPPRRIVSGLPFASLPGSVQTAVVDGTGRVLADGGEFRTFQYVHAWPLAAARRFRAAMAKVFSQFERVGPEVRNFPPAYVLVYRR